MVQQNKLRQEAEAGLEAACLACKSFDVAGTAGHCRSICTSPHLDASTHKRPLRYKESASIVNEGGSSYVHSVHYSSHHCYSVPAAQSARRPHHFATASPVHYIVLEVLRLDIALEHDVKFLICPSSELR